MDPIDKIIEHYNQHPSVVQIQNHVPHVIMFAFIKATETQIESEIKELNSKGKHQVPMEYQPIS